VTHARWIVGALLGAALAVGNGCSGMGLGIDGAPSGQGPTVGPQSLGEICPDDLEFFADEVWTPILSLKCAGCHNADGPAKRSRMVLTTDDEGDEALRRNYAAAASVAKEKLGEMPLLLLRPTGRHPEGHPGGKLIEVDSSAYAALEEFTRRVETPSTCASGAGGGGGAAVHSTACDTVLPGPSQLRRLSRTEYDRTVHDLLGIDSKYGASFVADAVVAGFDDNASALRVSPVLADQLRQAAESLAKDALGKNASLLPCTPSAGDAACAAAFVRSFGKRAYRRPLREVEATRYDAIFSSVAQQDGFLEGMTAVLAAMLQAPGFLYRTELGAAGSGETVELDGYEIASELSYLVWGSMPDEELFTAAESGALGMEKGIAKEAERLLADPKAASFLPHFFEQWLGIERIATVPKDATAFPGFDGAARAALRDEAEALIRRLTFEGDGTLGSLLTDPGDVPDGDGAGVLTLGAVLAVHGSPTDSSPIHRGKLVRERILCQELSPPPPNLNVQPPPVDPSLTTRERFAAHASVEPCKSCHRMIDPIGFGFEKFDGIGRHRTTEAGKAIVTTGEIMGSPTSDTTFDGTAALGKKLAESADVHACFATQWFRFGYGMKETQATSCTVKALTEAFVAGELKVQSLIVALTRMPHFRQRIRAKDVDTGPAGEPGGAAGASGTAGAGGDPAPGVGGAGGAPGAGGSTDPAGGGGAAGGASTGSDPAAMIAVDDAIDSKWETGACHTVSVRNDGASTVKWEVELTLQGTVTQVWNATMEPAASSAARFRGLDWNGTLAPGASASFGYCTEG
jgi:hypothetical protein